MCGRKWIYGNEVALCNNLRVFDPGLTQHRTRSVTDFASEVTAIDPVIGSMLSIALSGALIRLYEPRFIVSASWLSTSTPGARVDEDRGGFVLTRNYFFPNLYGVLAAPLKMWSTYVACRA